MGRGYRLLLVAYLASSLGNWVYRLTLPLLVLHLTGSAMQTGAVYAIEYIPFLLLSLPGGVLADRFERRRMLVGGDLAAGAIACLLGVIVATGTGVLWAIYTTAFLLACVEPVYHPAFQSIVPELVPADRLGPANARLYAGDNVVNFAGPVLAGAVVTVAGYQTTVFLDAATFFISATLIALIAAPGTPPRRAAAKNPIREALGYVTGNRILLAGALTFTSFNLFIWTIQANFVFYVSTYQHFGAALVGLMLGLQGAGAFLGAVSAGRLVSSLRPGLMITGANAAMGLLALALIPARGPVWIGLTWMTLFGFGAAANVAWFTLRQQIVPGALLGRVVALTRMIAYSSIPVAALTAGAIESRLHDMYLLMAIVGVGNLLTAIVASFSPLGSPKAIVPLNR